MKWLLFLLLCVSGCRAASSLTGSAGIDHHVETGQTHVSAKIDFKL